MCTVSFLPLTKGNYLLTSNRDEHFTRQQALEIQPYKVGNTSVYFPKDPDAGGTWIATTENKRTVCLLNGDLVSEAKPVVKAYRKSRGLLVLDYFNYSNLDAFLEAEDMHEMAPFTLLVLENLGTLQLTQLTWSGRELKITPLNVQQPHIWSSSTLYTSEQRQKRVTWFNEWLDQHKTYDQQSILAFHRFTGDGDSKVDLVMKKEGLSTVSICSIHRDTNLTHAIYHDLIGNRTSTVAVHPE